MNKSLFAQCQCGHSLTPSNHALAHFTAPYVLISYFQWVPGKRRVRVQSTIATRRSVQATQSRRRETQGDSELR